MLQVTERALDVISSALDTNAHEEEQVLRLAMVNPNEFGLALDREQEDDEVIRQGERPVLLLEPRVSDQLDGAVLDVSDGPDGGHLTIRQQSRPTNGA